MGGANERLAATGQITTDRRRDTGVKLETRRERGGPRRVSESSTSTRYFLPLMQ
jgi:hypothetical protein